jgi:hypothetical protein
VAAVCVAALADAAAEGVTLELVGRPAGGGAAAVPLQEQLAALFAPLCTDMAS